ncbi:unnamed protein product [Triticum turgidum subsp. durum]|uniref:Uncharacterized protein n=1 Tax=Triticum turgidum subsp. durum TaxID=4567 RepID=A0A9R0ZT11_TRITD|nr:unnamed protein product [Triticum turgidum subsp. durum]
MVSMEAVEMWETTAKKHPKRPKVLFLRRIDPSEARSSVKYVAADGPIRKKGPSIEFSQVQLTRNMLQNECIIRPVQSNSMKKPNSALKKTIVSEPTQAASELSSVGNSVMLPSASICETSCMCYNSTSLPTCKTFFFCSSN